MATPYDDNDGREVGEALLKMAEKLIIGFDALDSVFELSEPRSVVIKKRSGQYSKHPMIGGEEFVPTSAYIGKSGKMLIVLKPAFPSDFAYVEFPVADARKYLDNFGSAMDEILMENFDKTMGEMEKEADVAKGLAKIKTQAHKYNDDFASW